jgi:hypothetical protein
MTHGRSVFKKRNRDRIWEQEGLIDVWAPKGYTGLNWIKAAAYGWKKTTDLAANAQTNRPDGEQAPDNNSDTLAIFGSGMYTLGDRANTIADCEAHSLQADGRSHQSEEGGQRRPHHTYELR